MMAGRKGRSGGHNRLSLETHLLRGTFNATRHGRRAAAAQAAVLTSPELMPPALVEGLQGRGREFVEQTWAAYAGWSPPDLVLLHEAGLVLDQLETLRGTPGERAAQRLLLSLLAHLRVE
jgi:hypothetical protein